MSSPFHNSVPVMDDKEILAKAPEQCGKPGHHITSFELSSRKKSIGIELFLN